MDTTQLLLQVASSSFALLSLIVHGVFETAKPTLDLLIPAALVYLSHRYVRNKAVADALSDLAGTAYLHIGTQFASGLPINLDFAKKVAVKMAIASVDDGAKKALSHLTDPQVQAQVTAKLGKLLAQDPAFDVTDPLGKVAAAAAASSTLTIVPGATDAPPAPPADPAAGASLGSIAPAPVNFDLEQLVRVAVADGIAKAIRPNGAAAS